MKSYSGSMRLMRVNFTDALQNKSTTQYQHLKDSLEMDVSIYIKDVFRTQSNIYDGDFIRK